MRRKEALEFMLLGRKRKHETEGRNIQEKKKV
jgi:hypothetical protein